MKQPKYTTLSTEYTPANIKITPPDTKFTTSNIKYIPLQCKIQRLLILITLNAKTSKMCKIGEHLTCSHI